MKNILFILFVLVSSINYAQEFDSDLFPVLNSSSLHIFKDSEMSKMTVETYRNSKEHGTVMESKATYRKGKINTDRINFNIKYSEFYVLEDRKKSLGKYEFRDGALFKYERTDFDNNNARSLTLYQNYIYQNDIVTRENIRTKEYVAAGSVEFDTVVYRDTVIYDVVDIDGGYKQTNLTDPGVYTIFEIQNGQLIRKTVHMEGFNEQVNYTYDSKGRLVKITHTLTGEDTGSISTTTELNYTIDGLLNETKFYDESGEMLERKVFSYK
ncbi:MAG: hypothetical protein HUJ25_10750 [Crocinitomicaceae bacterium]|nr:hypothetical protein [Crocinitomicaceae bacterium]